MGKRGFRYVMNHLGDYIVDGVQKGCKSMARSTKGIALTYDIHSLERKKKKVTSRIGQRLAEIQPSMPENEVFKDEKLVKLFSILKKIEDQLNENQNLREQRLYPAKSVG